MHIYIYTHTQRQFYNLYNITVIFLLYLYYFKIIYIYINLLSYMGHAVCNNNIKFIPTNPSLEISQSPIDAFFFFLDEYLQLMLLVNIEERCIPAVISYSRPHYENWNSISQKYLWKILKQFMTIQFTRSQQHYLKIIMS